MLSFRVTDSLEEIRSNTSRKWLTYLRTGPQAAVPGLQLAGLSANMVSFCAAVEKAKYAEICRTCNNLQMTPGVGST